ncbi:uncharacterized protein [Littorina saxatilis]|uniref:uncharacterized protein n=1 Tax=Littorina saxatilis TaxID=31220 RepID=UPI0038B64E40
MMMLIVILLLATTFAFSGGALQIDGCTDGWLDVEEGVTTHINCSGLVEAGTRNVTWSINSYGHNWQIATCATSPCRSSHPDFQRVIMDDDNTTQLVTKEIDRDKHDNKTVKCVAGSMGATCSLNVISRAELSDCRVDIDTDSTVRGSCRFNKAYSSRTKGISCKWYRKYKGATSFLTDAIVTEQLTTLGNKTYYNGTCSFSVNVSRTETGTHTFYIDVMPGPGKTETGQIEITALFPTSVVVVILVVLVILATTTFTLIGILCRQRRQSRKESPQVADVKTAEYEEPVPVPASHNAGRAQEIPGSPQNAALESDDYEDAEAVSGFAAPAQGRGDYYSSLQMSNVRLRSDYSELGCQHDTA